MPVVVIAGRKGGIGKSTITGNLAAEFAAMGQSVVALDADPQHSLAAWAEQGDGLLSQCVEKVSHGRRRRAPRESARRTEDRRHRSGRHAAGHTGHRLAGHAACRSRASSLRPLAARPVSDEGSAGPGLESPRREAVEEAAHPVCAIQSSQEYQPRPGVVFFPGSKWGRRFCPGSGSGSWWPKP